MILIENFPLKFLNSFHTDVYAKFFTTINDNDELIEFYTEYNNLIIPVLILGGGNNILFTKNFEGTVLKIGIMGIEIIEENDDFVFIKANAGEDWDEFVVYCTNKNYGGLENLSLIPGQVGSSPIQNIGAYGTEVKDVISEVHTFNISTKNTEVFKNDQCQFEYRNSIFKSHLKKTHIITSVVFKLNKKPILNTNYESVQNELFSKGITQPTIKDIRQIICDIRKSKLPDPQIIGNAGSFFKNPTIDKQLFEKIKEKNSDVVSFKLENDMHKIATGWLIEKCGWKGYRENNVGVHEKQALVLVNYGNAQGIDILNLAGKIKQSIFDTFGIELEFEVNII